ncbi:MAG TPA: type II toxin-antitoxin system VapC family toxin [Bryobacteraceae bacterium]|jgi:ribonuclease VapC|nr:type II toxin-antitoxin system VapC family toxin [Bryobacteraceae bacterium]
MVIDTSVLMAILLGEPEADEIARKLDLWADELKISAGTVLELEIAARRRGLGSKAAQLLEALSPEVVPFTSQLLASAIEAYREYGPPHAARLNFGDCFSYAAAQVLNEPLFYKGNDFAGTPIGKA